MHKRDQRSDLSDYLPCIPDHEIAHVSTLSSSICIYIRLTYDFDVHCVAMRNAFEGECKKTQSFKFQHVCVHG